MSDRERKGSGRRRRRSRDRRGAEKREGGRPQGQGQGKGQQPDRSRPAERSDGGRRGRGGKGRGGGGGEGRRGPGREREPRLQYKSIVMLPEEAAAACPLCGKPVRDAVAALSYGEDHAPAHFDCVLEKLRAGRELGADEKLCYLGGGNFGVVRFPKGEGNAPFTINERIPYEPAQERPQWRRDLDSSRGR